MQRHEGGVGRTNRRGTESAKSKKCSSGKLHRFKNKRHNFLILQILFVVKRNEIKSSQDSHYFVFTAM